MTDLQKTEEKLKVKEIINDLDLSEKTLKVKRNFWKNLLGIMGEAGLEIELLEILRKQKLVNKENI